MAEITEKTNTSTLFDACSAIVEDAEQLLKLAAEGGSDKVEALRAKLEDALIAAKGRLLGLEEAALGKTKAIAQAADECVHEHPWKAIAAATIFGVIIGLLMNRR